MFIENHAVMLRAFSVALSTGAMKLVEGFW